MADEPKQEKGAKEPKEAKEVSQDQLEEQLSKEFKEYSVAEFFKRNRQMLGYSGKIRSLTTIVHEYASNSVTWDTPTVVRIQGETKIDRIGRLVDHSMQVNGFEYSALQDVESLRDFEKFEVLCFDKQSNKLRFKEVKSVHRHKVNGGEKIFQIKTVGNRNVETTRHHGLFTLRNGEVVEVKAVDLNVGDFLVVPRKPWLQETINEINILEEALKLPDEELGEFSIFGAKHLLYSNKALKDKIKSQLTPIQRHYDFYRNYMKCDRLPVRLLKILSPAERTAFYDYLVGERHCKYKIPCIFPISREFVQFLGLFIAEGSTRANKQSAALSFGSHESEIISFASQLIEHLFGFKPTVKNAHPTAINVILPSATIAFFLQHILKCGKKANSKRVPSLVFNLNQDLAREFLIAYSVGDGYPSKKLFELLNKTEFNLNQKITLATASQELVLGLQYLLSALGYSYSFQEKAGEQRRVKNVVANFGKSYIIEFYTTQINSPLNFYPLQMGGITAIAEAKLKHSINKRGQTTISYERISSLKLKDANISEKAAAFVNGDLGLLQVTEINLRDPTNKEFVYDYSVDGDENFVGGYGAICLHNSLDACEEAQILPEILVELRQLDGEKLKVVVEDNGTGIPKAKIGQALGKLLAGTKFHQRRQKRGQQGIGATFATLFAQMTTGKPIHVKSGIGDYKVFECDLEMDVQKNEPIFSNEREYSGKFRGLRIEADFGEVTYNRSEHSVYEYLRRTALANPHVQLTLVEPNNEIVVFPRASTEIPKKPPKALPHPLGISASELLEMSKASQNRKIASFLTNEFSRVSGQKVDELQGLVPGIDFNKAPSSLNWQEAEAIVQAIQKVKWIAPESAQLQPIGEDQIEKALKNLLQPEHMKVVQRKPKVFRGGIAFLVESAIAYGGKAGAGGATLKSGEKASGEVLRFANRTPLLFDAGTCATTQAVKEMDWNRYGLKNVEEQPVSIFINFVSVHVPYTGAGKLAISPEEEIIAEIKMALMECAREVSVYLSGLRKAEEQEKRKQIFFMYIGEVSEALEDVTKKDRAILEKKLREMATERTTKMLEAESEEEDEELKKLEKEMAKGEEE